MGVKWSDMPIRYDQTFLCERCNGYTTHVCTAYKDIEYRRCTRCGTETTWTPGGERKLEKGEERVPDKTKEESDFKRADKRKYKPRKKAGDEDGE